VIAPHHYRLVARSGSDIYHRPFTETGCDVDFHCKLLATPNHFLILKRRTTGEGLSLPVLQKPALMVPIVNVVSVVVGGAPA
jgi:hypothetical protein